MRGGRAVHLLALGKEFDLSLGLWLLCEVSAGSCWTAPGLQTLPQGGARGARPSLRVLLDTAR